MLRYGVLALGVLFLGCSQVGTAPAPPDLSNPLDELASQQYLRLEAYRENGAPALVKLEITPQGTAEADPDRIVMSRCDIEDWMALGRDRAQHLTRLIEAHEAIHERQFEQYGGYDAVMHSDQESRRAYEAQADMLGSMWMASSLDLDKAQPAILGAMEAMFAKGDPESNPEAHPTQAERLQAVRYGLIADLLMREIVWSTDLTAPASVRQGWAASSDLLRKIIGFERGDDGMTWSLATSRGITHWHAAQLGLRLVEPPSETVSPSGTMFSYALTYANDSEVPVTRHLTVYSAMFLDGVPKDGRRIEIDDADRKVITVAPHTEVTLTGFLSRMTRPGWTTELVYPPKKLALWYGI